MRRALSAPHQGEDEPVYPGTCREKFKPDGEACAFDSNPTSGSPLKANWRFHVPDGETITFTDGNCGPQQFVAGKDFGDFVVWRHDGVPAYQLSVVVDDAAMGITEVVRGADLLPSTARQLLVYRALGVPAPKFYHCQLMTDEKGVRLAKRNDALSLRRLRAERNTTEQIRAQW